MAKNRVSMFMHGTLQFKNNLGDHFVYVIMFINYELATSIIIDIFFENVHVRTINLFVFNIQRLIELLTFPLDLVLICYHRFRRNTVWAQFDQLLKRELAHEYQAYFCFITLLTKFIHNFIKAFQISVIIYALLDYVQQNSIILLISSRTN